MPEVLLARRSDWLQRGVDGDQAQRRQLATDRFGNSMDRGGMCFIESDRNRSPFQRISDRSHRVEDRFDIVRSDEQINIHRRTDIPWKATASPPQTPYSIPWSSRILIISPRSAIRSMTYSHLGITQPSSRRTFAHAAFPHRIVASSPRPFFYSVGIFCVKFTCRPAMGPRLSIPQPCLSLPEASCVSQWRLFSHWVVEKIDNFRTAAVLYGQL